MFSKTRWALALLALLVPLVLACGKEAPPMPPIRSIPRAATDLVVSQRGPGLLLETAYPELTTAGRALSSLAAIEVLRLDGPASDTAPQIDSRQFAAAAKTVTRLAPVDFAPFVRGNRLAIALPVPATGQTAERQTYAVRFVGPSGERSDLSNLFSLTPMASPLAPPTRIETESRTEGVALSWTAPVSEAAPAGYNVYRRADHERLYSAPIGRVEGAGTSFVDTAVQLGQRYVYSVTAVASFTPLIESAIAAEHQVDYRDRFAPPAPGDLIALAESDAVRLSWNAVDAADLAGYHVYQRGADAAEWTRRSRTVVTVTSFRAAGLEPGGRYRFRITAVDNSGNESSPSAEAEAVLP